MLFSDLNLFKTHLLDSIHLAQNITIITHKNPDGDGLAACLALKFLISKLFSKNSTILLEKKAPDFLSFLDVCNQTIYESNSLSTDLLICLDCHEIGRTNLSPDLFSNTTNHFYIDHHEIIQKAVNSDYNYYIDTEEVSTGIILHKMFSDLLSSLDYSSKKYYADCIYTTILNDTDNFLNSNVDKHSYQICAELMDFGLVPNKVIMDFMLKKPMNYYKFIGNVMSTLESFNDGQIVFLHSTLKMLDELGLDQDATSKMMRWTKGIEEAKLQVYFQEHSPDVFRLSFRSDFYDVSEFAKKFHGGGHKRAAGCEINADLDSVKKLILNNLKDLLPL